MRDMQQDNQDKLQAFWNQYREACPDPEPTATFMPGLWQKIDARRSANASMLRRIAQICVGATLALTVLIGAFVIPELERQPVYGATYVDVIAADHPNSYVDILTGDIK